MEHKTVMVREYVDRTAFHKDEQQLGREGWSVASKVNNYQQTGRLHRLLARFAPKKARFVVTYSRSQPA